MLSRYCYVNYANIVNFIATTSFDALSNLSIFIFRIFIHDSGSRLKVQKKYLSDSHSVFS